MALPADYDNPAGEALAEAEIRAAMKGLFLAVAAPYGYDDDHSHTEPRYPDTQEEFDEIYTIDDPDTADADDDGKRRLTRYFVITWAGMSRVLSELTIRYDVQISMGFKDSYAFDPTLRSYNQLVALVHEYGKHLADNQELGLDDRVSHTFLQAPLRPRWTGEDEQGNATVTVDCTLAVVLQVCKL